uniref:ribonuclease H n=1 Tax=Oryzias melastigma TaxID=30732 RepID=A0A3B3C1J5_ORYME
RAITLTSDQLHLSSTLLSQSHTIPELDSVPESVWASHKYDVGLIKNCEPLVVTPKSHFRPRRAQYPLKAEAIAGITPVFESFLKSGIITRYDHSPVNTPILPVKKYRPPPAPEEWRFVQDLTSVNAAVHSCAPCVPNPYTLLSNVPPDSKWFSVLDLSNAFFSVPVHPDSQFWFAFQFNGQGYTFTRMPQGFCDSPTVYNRALAASLSSFSPQPGSALLQYVDDVMICAPTREQCVTDTVALLHHLAAEGHKVSRHKMQFVQKEVTFLGHVISAQGKCLSSKHLTAIQQAPRPETVKQLLSFIGLCSYCRTFVPNFSELTKPLGDLTRSKPMSYK